MSGVFGTDPVPVTIVNAADWPDDAPEELYSKPLPVEVTNPSEGGGGGGGELPGRLAATVTLLAEMDPTVIVESGWYGSNTLGGPFGGTTDANGFLLQVLAGPTHVEQFLYLPQGVDEYNLSKNSVIYRRAKIADGDWSGFAPMGDPNGAQDNTARAQIAALGGSVEPKSLDGISLDNDAQGLVATGAASGSPTDNPFSGPVILEQVANNVNQALQRVTSLLDGACKQRTKVNDAWTSWRDILA